MEDNQIYLIKSGVDSFIEVTGTKLFSKDGNFGFHNSDPSMDVEISGDLNVVGEIYRSGYKLDKNSQSFTTSILSGQKNYEIFFPAEFEETPAIAVTLEIEDSSPIIPYVVSGVSKDSYHINFASTVPSNTYRLNTIFGGRGSFSGYHLDALSVLPPDFGGKWDTTGENIYFTGGNVGIGTSDPSVELDVDGSVNVSNSLTIGGDLNVNGNTTTVNSTTITVDDKNLELAASTPPTDVGADGGGIILKGSTDKSILWDSTNNKWNFNLGLTTSSNIGIGTTNPGGDLEILGSTSDANFLIGGAPGDPESPEPWRIQAEGDFFHIGQNKSSFAKYLTFSGSSVGIGTTTPSSRLEVFRTSQTGRSSKTTLLTLKAEYSGTDGKPYRGFGGGIEFRNEGYGNTLGPDSNGNNPGDIGYVTTIIKTYLPSAAIHGGLGDLSTSTDGGHISFSVQESVDLINDQNGVAPGDPGYLITYASSENQTQPVEKVRITHDGNVGIGTTNPVSAHNRDSVLVVGGGTGTKTSGITLGMGSDYSNGPYEILTSSEGSSASLRISDGTDARLTIRSNGNVGIGTTNPSATLQVQNNGGSNSYGLQILGNNTDKNRIAGFYDTHIQTTNRSAGALALHDSGTTTSVLLSAYPGANSYINNGGNVGIGTANPTTKLHVDGDARVVGDLLLGRDHGGGDGNQHTQDNILSWIETAPFRWSGSVKPDSIAAISMGSDSTNQDDGNIRFYTTSNENSSDKNLPGTFSATSGSNIILCSTAQNQIFNGNKIQIGSHIVKVHIYDYSTTNGPFGSIIAAAPWPGTTQAGLTGKVVNDLRQRMHITPLGNVGIGMDNNSNFKLGVNGGIVLQGDIQASDGHGSLPSFYFDSGTSSVNPTISVYDRTSELDGNGFEKKSVLGYRGISFSQGTQVGNGMIGGSVAHGDPNSNDLLLTANNASNSIALQSAQTLQFYTYASGAYQSRMYIHNNGHVGIGRASASNSGYNLDISGLRSDSPRVQSSFSNGTTSYGLVINKGTISSGYLLGCFNTGGTLIFEVLDNGTAKLSNALILTSDDRVKHNEQTIVGALDTLAKITPKKYIKTTEMYDTDHDFELDNDGNPVDENGEPIEHKIEAGIIAQEILTVDELAFLVTPEEVNEEGKVEVAHGVNYNSLFTYAIAAIKELKERIEELENK